MGKKMNVRVSDYWREFNSCKSVGTAQSYHDALRRLEKDMGKDVMFSEINKDFVLEWKKEMAQVLCKTTVNIYLRAFSALLHSAYEKKMLSITPKVLFSGMSIYGKNSSLSRKHYFMPVADWKKLWEFYETRGRGNKTYACWRTDYKKKNLEAAGLLLFMYLANGMNLRDLCALRYDKLYFMKNKNSLRFVRHKTAERTAQETEFPILPELRVIIERQGCEENIDGLVFPFFALAIGDEKKEMIKTSFIGHIIRKRMRNVAKALNWSFVPTPTWARHSFATNLIQSGVSKDYVAWAMAHADNSVTSNYIAAYSQQQMLDNNSLLLHQRTLGEELLAKLNALDEKTKQEIIAALIGEGLNT